MLYDITSLGNLKNKNKKMYIIKQNQTHRYREQISGYQWGEGQREGEIRVWY